MKKLYDLAVKTGEYTNAAGENKGRYVNVGAVMQKDDGGKMIFLERTFNPAGVPNPDNRSNIIVSMFPPKAKDDGKLPPADGDAPTQGDDDIPF